MQIVISSAGRFHAVHLARELEAAGLLRRFFSAGLMPQDYQNFPQKNLRFCWLVSLLDRLYVKFAVDRLVLPSRWYTLRDGLFDLWVSHEVGKDLPFNLLVGWANCSLKTMQRLRPHGIKTVLESGSMHIEVQEHILRTEYEKWGVKFLPVVKPNRDKMLAEYELADRISVPSSHVAQSFVSQGVGAEKIIKVPYGIDFARFGHLRKVLTNKFKLLFVGQLSLQKGIMYLLQAWQKLKLPKHLAELVLVGNLSAECRELVQKIVRTDQSISLVGSVPHAAVSNYLAEASAFVLPSVQEGLAMVIGEALAAGLPVIATTVTGAQEFILDGNEGLLVPPGEVDALAAAILTLFNNPQLAVQMGAAAEQTAQSWSWADYAAALVAEYKNLCVAV